nr:T9SS type A sorting domain-containing protein [Bacteroidales bacterium]
GTNLYRSDDGFTTPNKIFQIGGYEIGTKFPDFKVYKNHHPDQHNLIFMPSNPDIIISANDGGLSKSFNCMADTVRWEFLNNGYLSTQFYTIAIDENSKSDIIIGGLQDNGNYFVNSKDPQAVWTMPLNGDGAFCEFSKEPGIYYLSIQSGKVYKFNIENTGNIKGFRRIDPIGGKNYEFINSFVLDPNNSNIMYLAGGRYLYRNDSLNYINLDNKWDSISMGWYKFPDALKGPDTVISAVAVSKNPPNIVYYGTNQRNLFRIDNANNNFRYKRTNISDNKIFPYSGNSEGAKICCIAVDPDDGYKVIVVFSNYNVYSMFYSEDRGKTWMKVAGNLEANMNGSGAGPSFRWVSIMPFGKERAYFLGTSTGLYVTDKLVNHTDSTSTIWTKFGSEYIGNIVVNMIKTRTTDNLVVVATHGNGVFSTNVTYDQIKGLCEHSRQNFGLLSLYPNPASEYVNIDIKLSDRAKADIEIYSRSGELISKYSKYLEKGNNKVSQVVNKFENGIYFVVVRYNNNCLSKAFVVLK